MAFSWLSQDKNGHSSCLSGETTKRKKARIMVLLIQETTKETNRQNKQDSLNNICLVHFGHFKNDTSTRLTKGWLNSRLSGIFAFFSTDPWRTHTESLLITSTDTSHSRLSFGERKKRSNPKNCSNYEKRNSSKEIPTKTGTKKKNRTVHPNGWYVSIPFGLHRELIKLLSFSV